MQSDHQDELLHTTVSSAETSEIRSMAVEGLQTRFLRLCVRCSLEEVSDSISQLSDREVILLNRLILKLLDQCPSWKSSTQDAPPSEVQDTAEAP